MLVTSKNIIEISIACISVSFNRHVFNLHFQVFGLGFNLTIFLLDKK